MVILGMAERRHGAVIIVSSIAGLIGTGMLGAYGITKAADFAFRAICRLSGEPRNMRVNRVAPGLIRTDFARVL
jgi:NAD(P)-dependent dehydrogenase (short-subunit alcohol dehydrogenase family)